jgi:hypothetical protein
MGCAISIMEPNASQASGDAVRQFLRPRRLTNEEIAKRYDMFKLMSQREVISEIFLNGDFP